MSVLANSLHSFDSIHLL